jgi:hypothetical protein
MNIQGARIGNTINLYLDGKLHKKICDSAAVADEFYSLLLKAKEKPTQENIDKIRLSLNEKTRIAVTAGLEADVDTGEIYLAGFNTPIPELLVETIKAYVHHNTNNPNDIWPLDSITNFWKLLMINPDKRVRESLFDFIKTHDFVITDTGYMLVYKAVLYVKNEKNAENDKLIEYVTNKYLYVKKEWKCSPNKYTVYRDCSSNKFEITKNKTIENWNMDNKSLIVVGKLGDLYSEIIENKSGIENTMTFTDIHSKSMTIQLGIPVRKNRKECDSNPAVDCSNGLHVGATSYVKTFGSYNPDKIVLVCLVNPAHVIAVPQTDHSKMRVSEYFPIAVGTYENGEIDIVKQPYFESDYKSYEEQDVLEMIEKVKMEKRPIKKAIGAKKESRSMSELMNILQCRLLDIR